ncbi:MAG: metallophosphoesterase [Planctomycetota bacterium]|nr:metallophosphoesterase [Planctomycetota bacterium]
MKINQIFFIFCVSLLFSVQSTAHPPENHPQSRKSSQPVSPGMVLPELKGPHPWSDKPVLDDPSRFHIAIMTDRTGGHRPGVWMQAVESVNLLRPDFVMSVGDLIEGYTEDEKKVQAEWEEFLGFIDKMQMRFFFVAGNHDLTNPMMHKVWRERFGPEWYSFDYKGVHFICLCSEDPNFRIGDEQLAWLEKDLAQSKDARWTLVFLHKPLWFISERYRSFGIFDKTQWPKVEKLLHGRRHTVFAGHTHHYAQFHRNGATYYQLATTGGSSQLRGVPYGEFDHIMWLTMEQEGPYVVNLLLDGIVPGDRVTEETLAQFRKFLREAKVEVAPILLSPGEGLRQGQIDIRLINALDVPVRVSGRLEGLPLRGLSQQPVDLKLSAEAGQRDQLSVGVSFAEPIPIADLGSTLFRARVETEGAKPLRADLSIPVVIDRRYECPQIQGPVTLDGNSDDWRALSHSLPDAPLLVGPQGGWQGAGDADLDLDFARDKEKLYFFARVGDDKLVPGDQIVLMLDTRPIAARSREPGFGIGFYRVAFPAVAFRGPLTMVSGAGEKVTIDAVVARQDGGYTVEAAIPAKVFSDSQDGKWHSFQAAVLLEDVDEPGESPTGLIWRGTREVRKNNRGYGHFLVAPPTVNAK